MKKKKQPRSASWRANDKKNNRLVFSVKKEQKDMPERRQVLDIIVHRECPFCRVPLHGALFSNVEVDYCPKCLGLWFEDQELRLAKDQKDKNLQWLDVDIWKDAKKFKVSYGIRVCPSCRLPLYEVYYGDSGIIVDVCNLCHGIWLDRAEFKKIVDWLEEKAGHELLNNYAKNLFKEMTEIFTGPETLKEEILDFITVLKFLNYKFVVQYPVVSKMISQLPK